MSRTVWALKCQNPHWAQWKLYKLIDSASALIGRAIGAIFGSSWQLNRKRNFKNHSASLLRTPLRSTMGKNSVDLPQLIVTQQPSVTTIPESMCCSYSIVPHLMLERMENMICDSCLWVIVIVNKKPNGYGNLPAQCKEKTGKWTMAFPSMAALFSKHLPVCQIGISNCSTAIIHMPPLQLRIATWI